MPIRSRHCLTSRAVTPLAASPGGRRDVGTPGERVHSSEREYARWRARQIAYGRWEPWADAKPVRDHVRYLREGGASYHAIAEAAGVSAMMVHRLDCGEPSRGRPAPPRVRAAHARHLLAVTPRSLQDGAARRDAGGARLRLRALTAMGHPAISLARYLDVPPRTIWNLICARTLTITPGMHAAISDLYEQIWDLRPPESTGAERRAAAAARARAARNNWAPPAGLDDELIDDPAYRPRAQWRPATGIGVAPPPRASGNGVSFPTTARPGRREAR